MIANTRPKLVYPSVAAVVASALIAFTVTIKKNVLCREPEWSHMSEKTPPYNSRVVSLGRGLTQFLASDFVYRQNDFINVILI